MGDKNLSIPLSIIVAGIIVAGAVYFTNNNQNGNLAANIAQPAQKDGAEEDWPKEVSAGDHILGNPEAPIKIIEFSDTECPFCKKVHPTLKEIISNYGKSGQVAWVYR